MNIKSSLFSLSAIFVLWLALVLGCGGTPSSQKSNANSPSGSASPAIPPISVTSLALATAYEENEVAADQKYNGKTLLVTGKVESIDTVMGSTSVTLKGKDMSIVSVQCFVDDSQKDAVARLKKGQPATVQGDCDGKGLNVELKNCVIK